MPERLTQILRAVMMSMSLTAPSGYTHDDYDEAMAALDSLGVDLSRLQQERDALVDALTRYPLTWHARSEAEQQSFANVMEATEFAIKLRAAGLGEATGADSAGEAIRRLKTWAARGATLHFENGGYIEPGDVDALVGEVERLTRERDEAKSALIEAAVPLEVLAAQITANPYRELTDMFQQQIVGAAHTVRAALSGVPEQAEPQPSPIEFPCAYLGEHEPHHYQARSHWCPGVPASKDTPE